MPDESVFYVDSLGVKITSENVIVGKKNYELGEIKSFRVNKYPKSKRDATIMTICGAVLLPISILKSDIIFAMISGMIALFGVHGLIAKPTYMIRILHTKGEYPILRSKDMTRVEKVQDALEAALAMRTRSEAHPDT